MPVTLNCKQHKQYHDHHKSFSLSSGPTSTATYTKPDGNDRSSSRADKNIWNGLQNMQRTVVCIDARRTTADVLMETVKKISVMTHRQYYIHTNTHSYACKMQKKNRANCFLRYQQIIIFYYLTYLSYKHAKGFLSRSWNRLFNGDKWILIIRYLEVATWFRTYQNIRLVWINQTGVEYSGFNAWRSGPGRFSKR